MTLYSVERDTVASAAVLEQIAGMIERLPFGDTGHLSSRLIFGAAALGGMRQEKADRILELLMENGINHIDTASSYGDSELRIGPWMRAHRKDFFLASKARERSYEGARAELYRSLERLEVAQLDLIQMHNLVDEAEWQTAFADDGALRALVEARQQGLVRFIGVTGHGTEVARMHRRSLERFPFDSVLLPYNFTMMSQPQYAADFAALIGLCRERGVAVQTIKSIARRRWQAEPAQRFSWYEPLRDRSAVERAVRYVLAEPDVFLNTSSDATLLPMLLEIAAQPGTVPTVDELTADVQHYAVEPLFVPGGYQGTV